MTQQTLGPVTLRALASGLSVEEYCRQQLFDRGVRVPPRDSRRLVTSLWPSWTKQTSRCERDVKPLDIITRAVAPRTPASEPKPSVKRFSIRLSPDPDTWSPPQRVERPRINSEGKFVTHFDHREPSLPDHMVFDDDDWQGSMVVRAWGARFIHAGVTIHVDTRSQCLPPADPARPGGRIDWKNLKELEGRWKLGPFGVVFVPATWSRTILGDTPVPFAGTMRLFGLAEAAKLGLLLRPGYRYLKLSGPKGPVHTLRDSRPNGVGYEGDVARGLFHFTYEVGGTRRNGRPWYRITPTTPVTDDDFPRSGLRVMLNPQFPSEKDLMAEDTIVLARLVDRKLEGVRVRELKPSYIRDALDNRNYVVGSWRQTLEAWDRGEARAIHDKERVLPLTCDPKGGPEIDRRPLETDSNGVWHDRPYVVARRKPFPVKEGRSRYFTACPRCHGGTTCPVCVLCEGVGVAPTITPREYKLVETRESLDLPGTQHYVPTCAQGYKLNPWGSIPEHHGLWLSASGGERMKKKALKDNEAKRRSGLVDIDDTRSCMMQTRDGFGEGELQLDQFISARPWQEEYDLLTARRHVPIDLTPDAIHASLAVRMGQERSIQLPEEFGWKDDLGRRATHARVWRHPLITQSMIEEEQQRAAYYEGLSIIERLKDMNERAKRMMPGDDPEEDSQALTEMEAELDLVARRVTPDLRRVLGTPFTKVVFVPTPDSIEEQEEWPHFVGRATSWRGQDLWRFKLWGTPHNDDLMVERTQEEENAFRRASGEGKAKEGEWALAESGPGCRLHYIEEEVRPLLPTLMAWGRLARKRLKHARAKATREHWARKLRLLSAEWDAVDVRQDRPVVSTTGMGRHHSIGQAILDALGACDESSVVNTEPTWDEMTLDHDPQRGQGLKDNAKALPIARDKEVACTQTQYASWGCEDRRWFGLKGMSVGRK